MYRHRRKAVFFCSAGFAILYDQMHELHMTAVLRAGGYDIYPCGVYAAVAEYVGELCDILVCAVKYTGEQMTEIVRKYFPRVYIGVGAQGFHFFPNGDPAYRLSAARYENTSRYDAALFTPSSMP